jgi:hypothetical protein
MANRPIFITTNSPQELFKQVDIEFTFYNGFAITQKAKSIQSLHMNAKAQGYENILEVSTKSDNHLGWQLSAFNLMVVFEDRKISLESAFQGSKVFEGNVQYADIYKKDSMSAKKDARLRSSGNIIGFYFDGVSWENEPKTAFYDYLYMKTLHDNYRDIIEELILYDTFTDIEFNPKKSLNCQARTCAMLVSLVKQDLLNEAIKSKENFIQIVYKKEPKQLSLF